MRTGKVAPLEGILLQGDFFPVLPPPPPGPEPSPPPPPPSLQNRTSELSSDARPALSSAPEANPKTCLTRHPPIKTTPVERPRLSAKFSGSPLTYAYLF